MIIAIIVVSTICLIAVIWVLYKTHLGLFIRFSENGKNRLSCLIARIKRFTLKGKK